MKRILLTLAAALGLAITVALPASASTGQLQMTNGPGWCVGGTLSNGAQVQTVFCPGRTIVFGPGPGGTGTLHSATDTSKCMSPISASNLVVEWGSCSRTGVSFFWDTSAPNTHYFRNVHFGLRLSADNTRGDPLVLCPAGGCNGTFTFQQWTGP